MGIIAWIILGPVAGVIVHHRDHRRRRIGTPPARLPLHHHTPRRTRRRTPERPASRPLEQLGRPQVKWPWGGGGPWRPGHP